MLLRYKKLFKISLVHALGLWLSLVLAYNGYKQIVRPYLGPIPIDIKTDIKLSFIWLILLFTVFLVLYMWGKGGDCRPVLFDYIGIFVLHATLTNIIFYRAGLHLKTVMNLGEIIFVFLLIIFFSFKRLKFIPPIIYQKIPKVKEYFLQKMPWIETYYHDSASGRFILVFVITLLLYPIFLILKTEGIAEILAIIAYFSLAMGVGIDLYKLIEKERDERK